MKIAVVVSAILFTVLAAVAARPASAGNAERSLYQRLGGEPVMAKVIEQAIKQVTNDPAINQSFDKVNLKKLDAKIVEQICAKSDASGEARLDGLPTGDYEVRVWHARLASPAVARTINVVAGASFKTSIDLKPKL
jgi:hypothetical protein